MTTPYEKTLKPLLVKQLEDIRDAGTFKKERIITSPQAGEVIVEGTEKPVLNFCANNYLGLCDNEELIKVAKESYEKRGYGMSSVRFICGTSDNHTALEDKISKFYGHDGTILYSSCFDANAGLFETLLGPEDAIISDMLNHASIIDGVRLCKAKRYRYKNADMGDLEEQLQKANDDGCRLKMIATDGVFSMDGVVAPVDKIVALAEKYNAITMVDDSHATGFIGKTGRGSAEHFGVLGKVDIVTSTLGKALGGASGGYTTGRKEIIDFLRQRSRPYLFSNTLAPAIVEVSHKVFDMLSATTELRDTLEENTKYFREKMTTAGFDIKPGVHPIVPIMLGDAKLACDFADEMLKRDIYVIGFSYPVVPKGLARIRVQISAAHSTEMLDRAIAAFVEVGKNLEVIKA